MSLFSDIRNACRAVSDRATSVQVRSDRLTDYARSLPMEVVRSPSLDPAHHYFGTPERTLTYVVTIDAINFGSGYFPHLKKRPGLSGYFTVATSLREWFSARDSVAADDLVMLTPDDCTTMFGQESADAPIRTLMELFAEALNDLGRFVTERYDGRFAGVVEEANGSAERLVRLLAQMPFYRDVHAYHDLTVPFYKRGQITAADLSIALPDHPLGRFNDLDDLTIFADNLVPHVLRVDGLLEYDPALLDRINREEVIPAGSPEEIEIRACGLTAVEMLVRACERDGVRVTASQLDYYLWNRGQQPDYKAQPRHRTRCVYY